MRGYLGFKAAMCWDGITLSPGKREDDIIIVAGWEGGGGEYKQDNN